MSGYTHAAALSAAPLPLLWPDESDAIHDKLARAGIFHRIQDIDRLVELAREEWREQEGVWPHMGSQRIQWWIEDWVLDALDVTPGDLGVDLPLCSDSEMKEAA